MDNLITSSASGRICLFGDHQDYLGLPVIACPINKIIMFIGYPNNERKINIFLPDLDHRDTFHLDHSFDKIEAEDYIRLVYKVAKKHGIQPSTGYDINVSGNIPINAGLSSSSALSVAWLKFLFKAANRPLSNPVQIALLAYEAEVLEQGSSGGKMDQFTIAFDKTIFLDTKSDEVEILNDLDCALIVANSGEKKDTLGTLAKGKSGQINSLKELKSINKNMSWDHLLDYDLESVKSQVSTQNWPYLEAAVHNYRITLEALDEMRKGKPDMFKLGALMNRHHHFLKNNIRNTTQKIDEMIETALMAGASGAKIIGSGGGGCILALAEPRLAENIISRLKSLDISDIFIANDQDYKN